MKKIVLFLAVLFSAQLFAQPPNGWGHGKVSAVVSGNSVTILDDSTIRSCWTCEICPFMVRYEMQVNFNANNITWTQLDLCGTPCACDCWFSYSIDLDSIPNGIYNVDVYFTAPKFPGTGFDTIFEGTTQFTINNSTALSPIKTDSTESPCLGQYVGIKEQQGKPIKIFPNPTEGIVRISFKNNLGEKIEISDIYGKVIRSIKTDPASQVNMVDLSNLPAGIYFCRRGTERLKIIRQ
jgi:Secretion system C-terminal sorting domain